MTKIDCSECSCFLFLNFKAYSNVTNIPSFQNTYFTVPAKYNNFKNFPLIKNFDDATDKAGYSGFSRNPENIFKHNF